MRSLRSFLFLLAVIGSSGCALRAPVHGPLERPMYALPTLSLEAKAERLHGRLVAEHLNADGHLLYNVPLPLAENYDRAHGSADLPTWHGIWLSSEGFRRAVTRDPGSSARIHRGVLAIRKHFECTGVRGLLARTYVMHPGSEPLDWMKPHNPEDEPTKYWRRGEAGCWVRTGVAKGHYAGTLLGLSTLIGLEQRGALDLPKDTRALVERTTVDLVHHVIDGGYRIRDFDGEATEFGNLSDLGYNGFSVNAVTAWLRVCAATGDERCQSEYERVAQRTRSRLSVWLYGKLVKTVFGRMLGPTHGWYKPNDTIHAAGNSFAHWLVADDSAPDASVLAQNRQLLRDLGTLAQRDRNPYFSFIHALVVDAADPQSHREALATLRLFPSDKRERPCMSQTTREVQWIANLRMNSHYWKTRWNRRCEGSAAAPPLNVEYSGQDYLWAYYAGRFFGFISEAEARASVRWEPIRWDPLHQN